MANVVNPIFQHCNPFRTHTKGKAGVLLSVVTHAIQDLGMNHPRSHNLYPPPISADAAAFTITLTSEAVEGHIDTTLHEWEVITAEADLAVFAEHPTSELVQCTFEVSESDAFAHGQTFHLIKMPLVSRVACLVTITFTWHYNSNRWFIIFHNTGLHRGSVSSHQHVTPLV